MGTTNVGKVRPVFKGTYDASTTCKFYECWKYNGTWWLHIGESDTTGTAPSEGTVWTAFGVKGDAGDTGPAGSTGAAGSNGVRGSRWTVGTAITGTSTTGTVFSSSGITDALAGDMYMNSSTYNVYECTTGGAASVAKWTYIGNIKGTTGATGAAGSNGVSITGVSINSDGELVVTTNA